MSMSYLEDKEVFFAMKKLFNELYKREPKFKKVFDSFRKVTLEVNDAENLIFFIEEIGYPVNLGEYTWNIATNFPVSMRFTEIFLYDKESAYLYSGGVVASEDRSEEGFNYCIMDIDLDYPEMDEVLIREGLSNEWKKIKGVPSVFKKMYEILEVSSYDGATLVKIYNTEENRDLVVDIMSPQYGVLDRHVYGTNRQVDSYMEEVIKTIYDLKVLVSEVFIFNSGNISSARLRKNGTGEYTLVVE